MKFLLPIGLFLFPITYSLGAEEPVWEFTGAAGLSFSDGNSDSAAYSVQFLGSYVKATEEAYLGVDYSYSEDDAVIATDSLKIFGQYNHDVSERFYLGIYGAYFRDSAADIDYRIDPSILLGFRAIDGDEMKLTFEAGPGFTWRERGGVKSEFATARFSEKFEYHFNETTKLWQSASLTPRIEDFSDYLFDLDVGIETRLTRQWSLRSFVRHRIDSTPAVGKGRSDTAFILGAAYDFGGLADPDEASGRRSLMPGADAPSANEDGLVSTAAIGFSLNKGNSDSSALSLAWNTAYTSNEREFVFDIEQSLRENDGATSEDRTDARVQYNRFMSERFYLGGTVGYLRDDLADIGYRATPAFLAGYTVIKNDLTNLTVEAGPAYTFESQGGVTDDYASVVAAERFTHKFSEIVSLHQSIEYTTELADTGNFAVVAEVGLDTKISNRLIWKVNAEYLFENRPAAGRLHHDTSLTSSIAVKF
ncbi:YdiY family protein [Luteolibacter algae]|uniref:YdiY family protein n=1 Tax=Luteolibacter algae TaxID=454151 RepID=A0ABW5D4Z8_9BACT